MGMRPNRGDEEDSHIEMPHGAPIAAAAAPGAAGGVAVAAGYAGMADAVVEALVDAVESTEDTLLAEQPWDSMAAEGAYDGALAVMVAAVHADAAETDTEGVHVAAQGTKSWQAVACPQGAAAASRLVAKNSEAKAFRGP